MLTATLFALLAVAAVWILDLRQDVAELQDALDDIEEG